MRLIFAYVSEGVRAMHILRIYGWKMWLCTQTHTYMYVEKGRDTEDRMCAEYGRILHKKSLAIPMTHSSESMIWSQAEFTMLTFRRFSIFFSLSPSLPRSPTFNSTKMLSSRNVCFTRSILRRARIHLTHTHANMYKWILSTQKIIYTYYIRQYIHRVFFFSVQFSFFSFSSARYFPASSANGAHFHFSSRLHFVWSCSYVHTTHTHRLTHFTATNDV